MTYSEYENEMRNAAADEDFAARLDEAYAAGRGDETDWMPDDFAPHPPGVPEQPASVQQLESPESEYVHPHTATGCDCEYHEVDGMPYPAVYDSAEYLAAQAEDEAQRERECGCPYTTGPSHDPYGTHCDLDKGHDGDHSGPNPFGPGLDGEELPPMTWTKAQGAREMMRGYE